MIKDLLKGKVAIVTGGTRGIGLAIVRNFLEQGAAVALCGSKPATAEAAVKELLAENPNYDVMGIAPQLGNLADVEAKFAEVFAKYGHIDILVNNAGIVARDSIYDYAEKDFETILEVNLKGVFNCSKAAAKYMKEQKSGSIINTSSMVSLYGQACGCGYPATKAAVNGLTKSLAKELGKDNIRVNAVAPGVIRTDMVANLPPEMVAKVAAGIPLARVGEPEEVANVFLFLASDLASYVTGAVISVDGASQG